MATPGIHLAENEYGVSDVRVLRVTRRDRHHEVKDMMLDVRCEGDFGTAHTAGDNRNILPGDTMKNTIYVLAKQYPSEAIEEFALHAIEHFLTYNPQMTQVEVTARERPWSRLTVGEKPDPSAFVAGLAERRTTRIHATRNETSVQSGIEQLAVLRTAGAAFALFLRDPYTTLQETVDSLLSATVSASWAYAEPEASYSTVFHGVRRTLLEAFAAHDSRSPQHILYAMGHAVLDNLDVIREIRISLAQMPFRLVDMKPFGMENENEVFALADKPHTVAEATLRRDK
ncbi:MAG TPA: urate oxidase [Candidatus Acidoferrales bacterium]|nr:urate oxidase [Candidatus Acidoferrales bacterium]